MNNILLITQGIVSVLIIILILMQQRGTALGSAFGGQGEVYSTRRGAQKKILILTIILVIIFIGLSFANLMY
ncbi:MAG: preprotein translocase subunit SecG [Candidatus Pacebacteria bacterium]|nr:preprotein translocase subunit SecG [Candidatus Paceibacterota bacterium]